MVALFRAGKVTLLEGVEVDAKFAELHTMDGAVSSFAREDGTRAADHIILNPPVLEIICSVGNVGRDSFTPTDTTSNTPSSSLGRSERAKTALDALQSLRESRQLYDIATEHRLYTNMAFLGLSWGNEAPFAGRAEIRARFENFPAATVETFTLVPHRLSSDGTNKTASAEVDDGLQDAETEETAPPRSLAAQILNKSEEKYGTGDPP